MLIVMTLGRSIVRAVLFPYGNKMVTRVLDNQMNERFGTEFAKILDRTYLAIKDNMIDNQLPLMADGENGQSDLHAHAINSSKTI